MPSYSAKLVSDLIEQFRGGGLDLRVRASVDDESVEGGALKTTGQRPITYGLMEAFGEQLDDVKQFFDDLLYRRTAIEYAEGKQLDGIGEILCLTRKEAESLERSSGLDTSKSFDEDSGELTDARYRDYLIYKIWRNTNHCTQNDVRRGIEMFYTDFDVAITEDEYDPEATPPQQYPATIILETDAQVREGITPERARDQIDRLLKAPIVRAAGVGLLYRIIKKDSPRMDFYPGFAIAKGKQIVVGWDGSNDPPLPTP